MQSVSMKRGVLAAATAIVVAGGLAHFVTSCTTRNDAPVESAGMVPSTATQTVAENAQAPLRHTPSSAAVETKTHPDSAKVLANNQVTIPKMDRTGDAVGAPMVAATLKNGMTPRHMRERLAVRTGAWSREGLRSGTVAAAPPQLTQIQEGKAVPAPAGMLESNKGLWVGRLALSGAAPLEPGKPMTAEDAVKMKQYRAVAARNLPSARGVPAGGTTNQSGMDSRMLLRMKRNKAKANQIMQRRTGAALPAGNALGRSDVQTQAPLQGAARTGLRPTATIAAAVPPGHANPAMRPADAPLQEPWFQVTADSLAADYQALDSVALVKKYRGSTIELTAKVERLLNLGDELGTEMWIQTSTGGHVTARFADRGMKLERMNVGESTDVKLQCKPGGERNGTVMLRDCVVVMTR